LGAIVPAAREGGRLNLARCSERGVFVRERREGLDRARQAEPGPFCTFWVSLALFAAATPNPTPTPAATTAAEPRATRVIHFARGTPPSARSRVSPLPVHPIATAGAGAAATRWK
jgi:hypothetical protein